MTSRNTYPTEFKLEAIALIKDQGYTSADAGRALSVNPNLISRWCKEHDTGKSVFQGHVRPEYAIGLEIYIPTAGSV